MAMMLSVCLVQMRIQRIIAERFLPILDDVFVQHKTHILRTTAISGGVSCIAGILGSKSVELNASGALQPLARLLDLKECQVPRSHDCYRYSSTLVAVLQRASLRGICGKAVMGDLF